MCGTADALDTIITNPRVIELRYVPSIHRGQHWGRVGGRETTAFLLDIVSNILVVH
jgi:hypothetical protein